MAARKKTPSAAADAPAETLLRTGTDSPVSRDSSVNRSRASSRRASAGTRSSVASEPGFQKNGGLFSTTFAGVKWASIPTGSTFGTCPSDAYSR